MEALYLLLIFIWIVTGILSAVVAHARGHSGCGWFVIGMVFGLLALVAAVVIPKNEEGLAKRALGSGANKKCPACAEVIKVAAVKCRYCGADQPEESVALGPPTSLSGNRICPECDELIRRADATCRYCGADQAWL